VFFQMGCGTLDWSDLFDHVAELLGDEADSAVREHLASCDACRADSGELMVLSEGFWALGILTHVTGREMFADRARLGVREAMGDKSATRSTGMWRAMSSAESQRARRMQIRRRVAVRKAVAIALAAMALVTFGVFAFFRFGAAAYLVDTSGEGVEKSLGVDFADWGLRQKHEGVAALAREAKDTEDVRALGEPVWRLLRRELSSTSCRVRAAVLLEFAHTLTQEETAAACELIAAAVVAAGAAEEESKPMSPQLLGVVRKARSLRRAKEVVAAQEVLLMPVINEEPLALYYARLVLADSEGWEEDRARFAQMVERVPEAWNEAAWRRLRDGEPALARRALARAPEGKVRQALSALVAAEGKTK
jgi:hypothetical protein